MFFNCRVLVAVKLFLPDAVVKKSRQASNEKVKRSSSSVATQSVKRLKGKFRLKSYNAIVLQRHRNPALFQNFPPFSFLQLKNSFIKPAYNKPSVIFEGVIRCSCHFKLSDLTFFTRYRSKQVQASFK